jgi:hypothetical protein
MEEEDTLSDAPERSGSELVGAGPTLRNAIGQAFAHVVDNKVRVKIPYQLSSGIDETCMPSFRHRRILFSGVEPAI